MSVLQKCNAEQARMRTFRKLVNLFLAFSLSIGTGDTLSSKSYMIMSEVDESDFSSIRSEEDGT